MEQDIFNNPQKYLNDRLALIQVAQKGIQAKKLSLISELFNLNKEFIAKMFDLSSKSVTRYIKQNKRMNSSDSELILKLIILHQKGEELFGSGETFNEWLNKPAFGLDNIRPIGIISTSDGIDLILEELSHIEFGDLS